MSEMSSADWISLAQLVILALGGFWGLFLFRTARRGEARVAIEHSHRVRIDYSPERSLLLLRVRLRNTSNVLWRWDQSAVTLFDARREASDRSLRIVPFAEADPFLPVYGLVSDDAADLAAGRTFDYLEDQQITLEPGESVESEVAFPLDRKKLGLMGVHIWFRGFQRTRSGEPYEWATFFYVDPNELETTRQPVIESEAS